MGTAEAARWLGVRPRMLYGFIDRGELPWSVHSPEAKAVNAISLDPPPFADDMVHESD